MRFSALLRDRSGQTAIEFTLLACVVALMILTAVGFVGGEVDKMFGSILEGFEGDS